MHGMVCEMWVNRRVFGVTDCKAGLKSSSYTLWKELELFLCVAERKSCKEGAGVEGSSVRGRMYRSITIPTAIINRIPTSSPVFCPHHPSLSHHHTERCSRLFTLVHLPACLPSYLVLLS